MGQQTKHLNIWLALHLQILGEKRSGLEICLMGGQGKQYLYKECPGETTQMPMVGSLWEGKNTWKDWNKITHKVDNLDVQRDDAMS